MENVDQRINQKNIGSGSSTTLNCGTNIVESDSTLTCPGIPGETPAPTPRTTAIPVVTQRVTEVQVVSPITEPVVGEAQCNPDEVVTGGGYDITKRGPASLSPPSTVVPVIVTNFKEFSVNNAWHVEVFDPSVSGTMRVFAECFKLVPAQQASS
jgi:hypothetical protein